MSKGVIRNLNVTPLLTRGLLHFMNPVASRHPGLGPPVLWQEGSKSPGSDTVLIYHCIYDTLFYVEDKI